MWAVTLPVAADNGTTLTPVGFGGVKLFSDLAKSGFPAAKENLGFVGVTWLAAEGGAVPAEPWVDPACLVYRYSLGHCPLIRFSAQPGAGRENASYSWIVIAGYERTG